VKIVFVELSELLLTRWMVGQPQSRPLPRRAPQSPVNSNGLPKEIENALSLLGLKGCRDWNVIHKRYRELAKRFHPDLNPDITSAGNRFMIYDGAYRRLSLVKEKYFLSSTCQSAFSKARSTCDNSGEK
ncbi:MAG: J domain-containing protein, partial [Pseudomonadota bacterium]